MELILKDIDPNIIADMKEYLTRYTDCEEGGLLLGTREWNNDKLTVEATEFVPVKSNYQAYDLDPSELGMRILPGEAISYYPDPKDMMKVLERTVSLDPQSKLMLLGFVHNHPGGEAFPSVYDLTHVTRNFGYLMAIYSNKNDHIRVWYVSNIKQKDKKWDQIKSGLLPSQAVVELAVTL